MLRCPDVLTHSYGFFLKVFLVVFLTHCVNNRCNGVAVTVAVATVVAAVACCLCSPIRTDSWTLHVLLK